MPNSAVSVRGSSGSRNFEQIAGYLQHCQGAKVLELGSLTPSTLQFLLPFKCKLTVLDTFTLIATKQPIGQKVQQSLAEIVQKFDLILCGGLFNYIAYYDLQPILTSIVNHSNPNALLHFILQDKVNISAVPPRLVLAPNFSLTAESESGALVRCERHTLRVIKSALPGFNSKSSLLMKNGVQENLWIKSEIGGAKLDLMMS